MTAAAAGSMLRKGGWLLGARHRLHGYNNDQVFKYYKPWWVFGTSGPLAAWC